MVQKDGEYWSLNTPNILGVVVEAMKEQQQIIENQANEIEALKVNKLAKKDLEKEMKALQIKLNEQKENFSTRLLELENIINQQSKK